MKNPLLALAACFALGIALARPEHARLPGMTILLACAVCLLLGLVALRAGFQTLSVLLALAGFVSAGAIAAQLFEFRFAPNHLSHLTSQGVDLTEPLRLEGVVVSTPFRTPYGLQFEVDVRRLESRAQFRPATGRIRLRLQAAEDAETFAVADSLHLRYGDSIRALVRLRRPHVYQNPGSFDFRRWMESIDDLYWVGTIRSPLLIEKLPGAKPPRISSLLEKTRQHLIQAIDRLYPPWTAEGRDGAVLKAVLLGDRSSLNSDTVESFRKAGLYHLLVIAGLHVGLLAMLVGMALRLLPLRESSRTALVLLFLLAYASLVEQRAPTLRATLMISVYLLGRLFYRAHVLLNAIGLAALVLLVHRPAWLFESGFELSFAAALLIAGLVVPILERTTEPYRRALWQLEEVERDSAFAPRLAQLRLDARSLVSGLKGQVSFLNHHPALAVATVTGPARLGLWTANIFLFSAILQLGLLLPMTETFHRVSYAGIGLNALALPLMTLLLAFAVPTVILSAMVPAVAPWLARVLAPFMSWLFALTDLPHLPAWLSYRIPEPPSWVVWGFALSVVIVAWALGRYTRAFWASLGALGVFALLISLHPSAPRLPRGWLEVTALDCGGGDALFLVLPDQTTMLVDACGGRARPAREGAFQGRRWDPGEEIVSPYLWSRGIKKIDILVLSDAREDRLPGLAAVVRNFRIGEFWHGADLPTPAGRALLEQIRRRDINTRRVTAGDLIARGQTSVRVLWPPNSLGERSPSRQSSNDDSVVLRITHGAASVLLPGDISGKVEEQLARSALPLESQVLKVAHHGSRSSSSCEFLARVSPRVALVTGESSNLLNSSNPGTLNRLQAAGARIFRTDLEGAVTVELRANALAVHSYSTSEGEGTARASSGGAGISRVR